MKLEGTVVANGERVYVLTEKESDRLQTLVDRVVERRKRSYKLYRYDTDSPAHIRAQELTDEALDKVQAYLSKTLGVTELDPVWDQVWGGEGISYLGDVKGPESATEFFKSAAKLLLTNEE
jgi:hypothetical protein